MIQTRIEENYVEGTEQKTGTLYVDTNMTTFLNHSNGIVVYLNIGVVLNETDELNVTYTRYKILTSRPINYTQEEMKDLITATGEDFNSPVTNLLIDEINRFSDSIILNDITNNPQNYFGLTADLWHKAQ